MADHEKTEAEWRKTLTPEQFRILREHGTERPGSSPLNAEHRAGEYLCAGCGQQLFESDTKFDAHCGWPSFHTAKDGAVATKIDNSHFMTRTEVLCAKCGGHLGHVFDDGPEPTGLRYCMNGAALNFEPEK
jgi:peptide-methionine (R)-S-oxide reductase